MSISTNATIVVVNGAWADGSSWQPVIRELQKQGFNVIAAPIPLTSLDDDAAAMGYVRRDRDAIRHLMRIASGLEAMILGEAQIQGQVRRAYDAALERETTGAFTNHLFKAALATGKRVRTETAIGAGQMSLPSVSAMLAKEVFGELAGRRAGPRRLITLNGHEHRPLAGLRRWSQAQLVRRGDLAVARLRAPGRDRCCGGVPAVGGL